ncbi:MAG: WD40 repeat domain-containing protein, partial [Planctomycetota bacterium]|nr:WD40 repeat domain-containing protein [Planctomycetota bacterium]
MDDGKQGYKEAPSPLTSHPTGARGRRRFGWLRFSLRTLVIGVLLAGSSYGVWFRWNPTWQVERRLGGAVSRVIYSADGTRLLTTGNDGGYLWDSATGKQLAALTTPQQRVWAAVLSPAGGRIVTVSAATPAAGSWGVHTWDVETGRELSAFTCVDNPQSLVLSPAGGRIATSGHNNVVRIWDAATGTELAALAGQERIRRAVCFSGDGSRLITHGGDPMQRVWDAATGKELLELKGHEGRDGWVNDAAFSPDGRFIVTASGDATARVWDAESGAAVAVLTGHGDGVKWARFSPDGGRVVTASDDCTARVWDVHSGRQL